MQHATCCCRIIRGLPSPWQSAIAIATPEDGGCLCIPRGLASKSRSAIERKYLSQGKTETRYLPLDRFCNRGRVKEWLADYARSLYRAERYHILSSAVDRPTKREWI